MNYLFLANSNTILAVKMPKKIDEFKEKTNIISIEKNQILKKTIDSTRYKMHGFL